jgi:predicted glycoside hydrolase/deacetylase ChbG (UPF0249 family)
VYRESKAQMELCLKILGRVPDTTWIQPNGSDFEKARMQICKEYGIAMNFADKPNKDGNIVKAFAEYRHLNIYMPNQPATVYRQCYSELYCDREKYDPIDYYVKDEGEILNKEIALTAWHPGYLDHYVMSESSLHAARVKDVESLTSESLKKWIISNRIELVNTRDALFGTREYQNHLDLIKSPLAIR